MYHIGDFKMEIVLAEHKYATIKVELFNPKGEEEAEGWVSDIVNKYDRQKDGSYLLTDRKARAVIDWCYDWVYKTVEDNKPLYSHGWRLEMNRAEGCRLLHEVLFLQSCLHFKSAEKRKFGRLFRF